MITVPLYAFLFIYLAFLVLFAIFSIVNIMHIITTGSYTFASFVITLITLVITLLIFFFTIRLLVGVNWQQEVVIFNGEWVSGIFEFGT
ncbi:MAG: hypothetical protein ABH832_02505 [bacterium]